MRPILFGLIAVLLGCLGIDVPIDHTSTVSGTYGLKEIGFNSVGQPCYTSTMADPTLVPPDVNTAFLTIGTLRLDADGTGVFNAHYEVRHESNHSVLVGAEDSAYTVTYVRDGMDLKIIPWHYGAIRFQPSVSGIRTANCVRPAESYQVNSLPG
jgi:hypothetical protein